VLAVVETFVWIEPGLVAFFALVQHCVIDVTAAGS
jgi:hypothetical protein